ncbi:uncharacterized protein LY89DRAFT_596900 [Mollisia scopiformis]|uniref:Uncharacterized protein n=1 Tax=Mollisia scopiformis TaxID=149040 RepID=A0A132BCQ8_MOLSC|nr:uncharacterized protein LY89DRAFT_596900 [Mollisia scopiformis]KUJ10151.1 hypothetical protein LY89DRAFT_596900 [Mollisia scopiformis]
MWRDQLASTTQRTHRLNNDRSLNSTVDWNSTTQHIRDDNDKNGIILEEPLADGPRKSRRRVCIGIDYGTTFTSVSYHIMSLEEEEITLPQACDIKTIRNWPDDSSGNAEQVPTESWYPEVTIKRCRPYEQFDEPEDMKNSKYFVEDIDSHHMIRDEGEGNENDITPVPIIDLEDDSSEFFWGYSVSYQRYHLNSQRDPSRLLQRPKLMMLSTEYTEQDRKQLRQQVQHLVKAGVIRKYGRRNVSDMRDVRDIITDFLVKVFEHTKKQLEVNEDFDEECSVEFVLAVPTIWSSQASRVLQLSVEAAIRASSFGSLVNNSLVNLFIVPEPEAGVTWMLQRMSTTPLREAITCLDAGGGTVDCATYQVCNTHPTRLGTAILEPTGDNCGGSCLNDNFRKHLRSRLHFEKYLVCNDNTLESIINRAARDFEAFDKPRADIMAKAFFRYRIDHLKGDPPSAFPGLTGRKRFENNILIMEKQDYEEIYLPILRRVWAVLKKQLDVAREKTLMVKTVFLIGGFSACPSLISVLKARLIKYERDCNLPYTIRLIEDKKKSVAAVSAGAVLRALDKANGPPRVIQSSYGFLRREPIDPEIFEGHKHAYPSKDPNDGDWYVDVINYVLHKGHPVLATQEFEPIKMLHSFAVDEDEEEAKVDGAPPKLLCHELLYVSDTATESHFPFKGFKNRDVQLVGRVVTDITCLKDQNLLEIVEPETDHDGNLCGKRHYKVEYDLVPMIRGRDLIYETRWPSSDALARVENDRKKRRRLQKHEFKKTAQISIAAAFMPGTS